MYNGAMPLIISESSNGSQSQSRKKEPIRPFVPQNVQ